MTVRDLSEFTGKRETTVRNWLKKACDKNGVMATKNGSSNSAHPADYNIDEVEMILNESTLGQNAILILMESARRIQPVMIQAGEASKDDLLISLMENQQKMLMMMMTRMDTIEAGPIQKEKKALPAPVKADRDKLRQLVSEYAVNILDGDHQGAWHRLYAEIYYRCHKSIKVLAKNSRISKLDMIERLGLLDEAVAILIEMMGE